MRSRALLVAAALATACAPLVTGCVADDTEASPGSGAVQGGSGPPPSSYEDATLPGVDAAEYGEDAATAEDGSPAVDGGDASDAAIPGDASDAAAPGDSGDAGDGA